MDDISRIADLLDTLGAGETNYYHSSEAFSVTPSGRDGRVILENDYVRLTCMPGPIIYALKELEAAFAQMDRGDRSVFLFTAAERITDRLSRIHGIGHVVKAEYSL